MVISRTAALTAISLHAATATLCALTTSLTASSMHCTLYTLCHRLADKQGTNFINTPLKLDNDRRKLQSIDEHADHDSDHDLDER